jgi:hypothetical protein
MSVIIDVGNWRLPSAGSIIFTSYRTLKVFYYSSILTTSQILWHFPIQNSEAANPYSIMAESCSGAVHDACGLEALGNWFHDFESRSGCVLEFFCVGRGHWMWIWMYLKIQTFPDQFVFAYFTSLR